MELHKRTDSFFPIRIDLTGKRILIIGSGGAALRLASLLSSYSGKITVLARTPSPDLAHFCKAAGLNLVEKAYERDDLYGMDLVFNASDSAQVQTDVAAICRTMGIFLYTAGRPDKSDFVINWPQEPERSRQAAGKEGRYAACHPLQ